MKFGGWSVLTGLLERQSFTGDGDLLLGCPDPVQHAPPAFDGEGEVGAGGRGALVDAHHWGGGTVTNVRLHESDVMHQHLTAGMCLRKCCLRSRMDRLSG